MYEGEKPIEAGLPPTFRLSMTIARHAVDFGSH